VHPLGHDLVSLEQLSPVIQIADGLTLSQVCSISGLESSTIHNWVKRKFVPHPVNKKYSERHLARILLISALRYCMRIESIGELMTAVNGDTDDESDDIISEQDLYGYFIGIAARLSQIDTAPKDIDELIVSVMSDYHSNKEQTERLRRALTVMAYAYIASGYKKRADGILAEIRG
jgi:DNA-binding transcriptional MerR regulator